MNIKLEIKNKRFYAMLVGLIAILIIALAVAFLLKHSGSEGNKTGQVAENKASNDINEDAEIQMQLEQLKKLRGEQGLGDPTQEEITAQLKQLDEARKKAGIKTPTAEEVQKQLQQF